MDSVPYAFCEAVCGVLCENNMINKLCEDGATDHRIWNLATKRTQERRLDAEIHVDCRDEKWSYAIEIRGKNELRRGDGRTLSFQELKKLDRQHIHLTYAWIGSQSVFANRTSTVEEIGELLKFTAPCVNLSDMMICERCTISKDDLSRLLSFYQNATFRQVCCYYRNRAIEEFLIAQMQTNALEYLTIAGDGWTEDLRLAIEEFALNKDFRGINVRSPSLVFGRAFFDALIQKPFFRNRSTFDARFSFDAEELVTSGFQEIGLPNFDGSMRWIRRDGGSVTILQYESLSIELKHPLL